MTKYPDVFLTILMFRKIWGCTYFDKSLPGKNFSSAGICFSLPMCSDFTAAVRIGLPQ